MTLKQKVEEVLKQDGGTQKIADTIRGLENELIQSNAVLESIEELLDGKEVSDFMESFPVVRRVADLIRPKHE